MVTTAPQPKGTTTLATSTASPFTIAPVMTGGTGSCSSVALVSSAWAGGFTVALVIPISTTVSSWLIDVTFSAPLSSLQVCPFYLI